MSSLAKDTLEKLVRRVARMKKPDWSTRDLASDQWDKISKAVIKALDEMKDHGAQKPLGKLQAVAFGEALANPSEPLHTVALWLTDTRLRVERLKEPWIGDRKALERRGILKPRKEAA